MYDPLTPEQLLNWRKKFAFDLGPYASIMPDAEIQDFHNRLQDRFDFNILTTGFLDAISSPKTAPSSPFCDCNPITTGSTRHMNDKITCNACHKERNDNPTE